MRVSEWGCGAAGRAVHQAVMKSVKKMRFAGSATAGGLCYCRPMPKPALVQHAVMCSGSTCACRQATAHSNTSALNIPASGTVIWVT